MPPLRRTRRPRRHPALLTITHQPGIQPQLDATAPTRHHHSTPLNPPKVAPSHWRNGGPIKLANDN